LLSQTRDHAEHSSFSGQESHRCLQLKSNRRCANLIHLPTFALHHSLSPSIAPFVWGLKFPAAIAVALDMLDEMHDQHCQRYPHFRSIRSLAGHGGFEAPSTTTIFVLRTGRAFRIPPLLM
ncbi:unnamed protein product, partial [Urochloa humidicola]